MRTLLTAIIALLPLLSEAAEIPRPTNIVTREEWKSTPDPIPDNRKHKPRFVTIHHAGVLWTNSQTPEQFLRNMQAWGKRRPEIEQPPRNTYWPDLAYHFLIGPDGRIFEGRDIAYEPESNTKYELAGNLGVEMMGDFNQQRPSPAQLESAVRLTAWLADQHDIKLDNIRTHRDAAPGSTSCPGDDFYRYFESGEFKRWVEQLQAGEEPQITQGEPLPKGPTESILDTKKKPPIAPPAK